jgi:hypothetical protein
MGDSANGRMGAIEDEDENDDQGEDDRWLLAIGDWLSRRAVSTAR